MSAAWLVNRNENFSVVVLSVLRLNNEALLLVVVQLILLDTTLYSPNLNFHIFPNHCVPIFTFSTSAVFDRLPLNAIVPFCASPEKGIKKTVQMKINFMANMFIKNDLILSYCLFALFHSKQVFIQKLLSETVDQVVETLPVKYISFILDIKNRDNLSRFFITFL